MESRLDRLALAERPVKPGSPASYAVALLLTGVALGARVALGDRLVGVPFITFFPAVILSAFLGGLGPGLVSIALSTLAAWYVLIPPRFSWGLLSASDALSIAVFVGISVAECVIVWGLVAALERIRAQRRALAQLSASLEARVAERTAELATANKLLRQEIAERERAEAVARQAQKMEAIGNLTGGIAHDFNNLLTVIIGNLDAVQRRLDSPAAPSLADLKKLAASAARGASRAATLTQHLLAFSRRQALQPQAVELDKLVAGISDMLRRSLGEAIEIEIVRSGGLWRTLCDPTQLETALLNIAINARDAMPKGGKLTIETANVFLDDAYAAQNADVTPGQYVMLAVTDTGSGMTEETIGKAFDPFFTTKGVGQGTGLGLSMVYGFIKQSGGHAKIYSEPGQGTTVKLYLPRHAAAGEAGAPVTAPPSQRSGAAASILLVEDDAEVRSFIAESLLRLGHRVLAVGDCAAALAVVGGDEPVDLLLTDVGLPGMSGREVADRALALRPALRVLFTSGYTRNAIVHGGRLDPGVLLLPKPFTADVLARKVDEALSRPAG